MENLILIDAVDDWMVKYKRKSVKPSTYDRLVVSRDMMARYSVSSIPIDILTSDDIQDYLNDLVENGYALSTIKKQYHLLSAFIEHANLKGLIRKPVHKGVSLPAESSVKKHRIDICAYTRPEQQKLLKVLERADSPAYAAAILMMETGMRVGEVLALGWSDIDWRRRAIRIHKTVVRISEAKRSYIQDGAKSYASNRLIPLSKRAYGLLETLREFDLSDDGFVFHDERGNHLSYETLRWWIHKACDEAGVPYYGQHVFRHTFATNCYENGCDVKQLSKLLGHSDVTITYNVYIHLFGDALEELRSVVG